VTLDWKTTGSVVIEKLALVDPGAMVTLEGTRATKELLLERATTAPPLGAGPFSVTVALDEFPPVTVDGLSVKEVSAGGSIVSEAVCVVPAYTALIVTEVAVPTALVLTVKMAFVAPGGTVTVDGTVATPVLLLERTTTAPPLGAGPFSVTVALDELPPVTVAGLSVSDVGAGGVTVSEAVCVVPAYTAVIVTEVAVLTALVFTVKMAFVAPAWTVTVDGTVATLVLPLVRATTAPPAGAGAVSVTLPVEDCTAPRTVGGSRVNDESVGFGAIE
jgi:hypothetical protein